MVMRFDYWSGCTLRPAPGQSCCQAGAPIAAAETWPVHNTGVMKSLFYFVIKFYVALQLG